MCHRMLKQGLTPDKLFHVFTDENEISEQELISGSRRLLDIHILDSDILIVRKAFSSPIGKEYFVGRLNVNIYYENCKKQQYSVSVVEFLHCLI